MQWTKIKTANKDFYCGYGCTNVPPIRHDIKKGDEFFMTWKHDKAWSLCKDCYEKDEVNEFCKNTSFQREALEI